MISKDVQLHAGDVLRQDAKPYGEITLVHFHGKRWTLTASRWSSLADDTIRHYYSTTTRVTKEELDEVKKGLEQWLNG